MKSLYIIMEVDDKNNLSICSTFQNIDLKEMYEIFNGYKTENKQYILTKQIDIEKTIVDQYNVVDCDVE